MSTTEVTASEEQNPPRLRHAAAPQAGASFAHTPQDLIKFMEPGKRYTASSIAGKLKIAPTAADSVLLAGVKDSMFRTSKSKGIGQYWVPTQAELESGQRHLERSTFRNSGPLTGYDTLHQQFRELCMLARR